MEKQFQQFNKAWVMDSYHDNAPQIKRGDVCLTISQDLAQVVTIVESDYYEFLDKDN